MEDMLKKAHDVHQAGDLNKAELMYDHLLNYRPNNFLLQFFLGTLYFQKKRNGLAINLLTRCVEQKPEMHEAWTNLGCAYRAENKMDEALKCYEKSEALIDATKEPEKISMIYNNIGSIYVAAGNPKPGEEALLKALKYDPNNTQSRWNMSLTLLEQERWVEGWENYDAGIESGDRLDRNFDCEWWDGDPDKTLIVYGEQGLGDEIMFYSIIPDVMKDVKKVVIECNPRLTDLIARSFPDVDVYGTRKLDWIDWPTKYENRAKIAAGSLAKLYRKQESDWPVHDGYITADPKKVDYYRSRYLTNRLKVGISWIGGGKKTLIDERSMALMEMLPLLQLDAEFVSLQYTKEAEREIAQLYSQTGIRVHHWPEALSMKGHESEYDETAALVGSLDLIITVCTSVAHLGGAMNMPVWVLTPHKVAWRYGLTRPSMIWYQNQTTLLRKGENESWEKVIQQAAGMLEERIKQPLEATA